MPYFRHAQKMPCVASIILGGGEGKRLQPLTLKRCKPSIPFGGNFCLIDIPISLSLLADCHKIFIITQYLSYQLHRHISQVYVSQRNSDRSIEILSAEQRPEQKNWFAGTADAVRQNMEYLLDCPADYFLILGGDQLYHLDFRDLVHKAMETDADMVLAALPVQESDTARFGILKVDQNHTITNFHEKPTEKHALKNLNSSREICENFGSWTAESKKTYLASMGIYLFKRKALIELLKNDLREDFGKHLIPTQLQSGKSVAFLYDGYWEDIGNLSTFYQANLLFTQPSSPLNLYQSQFPISRQPSHLPPTKLFQTKLDQTLLCEGGIVESCEIINSLIGPRTMISHSLVKDSYIMGNDYYQSPSGEKTPQVGQKCILNRCIIDKNVRIGNHVQLINKNSLDHFQSEWLYVREGIIVVPTGTVIPDNFTF